MKPKQFNHLSIKEYQALESNANLKYEFCGNIYAEIRTQLQQNQKPCKAVTSELKLYVKDKNSFLYPDTMVVCGPLIPADEDKHAITNPILVVEVLSKSTAEYDRGEKFHLYRQLASLQEYVLIEQDKYVVEVYYKAPDVDLWRISRFEGLETIIQLDSLGIHIKMSDLYYDIDLNQEVT